MIHFHNLISFHRITIPFRKFRPAPDLPEPLVDTVGYRLDFIRMQFVLRLQLEVFDDKLY